MSLFKDFIAAITVGLFSFNENENITNVIPIMDLEDTELGKITKKIMEAHEKENYVDCEFKSIIQNPDLELGFGPIVEINSDNDVTVDITAFEKNNVYESYISFMETISYLTSSYKNRNELFKDLYPSWKKQLINSEYHIVMHIQSGSMGLRLNKQITYTNAY